MEKIRFIFLNNIKGRHVLKFQPVGWDEAEIVLKRSEQYHGIDIEYTSEFSFIKDGKQYLDDCYENEGIESVVEVIIQELVENSTKYETIFTGTVNFSNYTKEAEYAKVNLEQSGFKTRFVNSTGIEVDLLNTRALQGEALQPLQPAVVELHSRAIDAEYHALANEADCAVPVIGGPIVNPNLNNDAHGILYFSLNNEIVNELSAVSPSSASGWNLIDNIVDPLFHATGAANHGGAGNYEISIRLKGSFKIDNKPVGQFITGQNSYGDFDTVEAAIYFAVNDPVNAKQVLFYNKKTGLNTNNLSGGWKPSKYYHEYDVATTKTVNINLGDKVYLWAVLHASDIDPSQLPGALMEFNWTFEAQHHYGNCEVKVNASTQVDSANVNGLLNYEVGERLLQSITGAKDSFFSEIFGRTDTSTKFGQDGRGSLLFLTSGGQLRGFALDKMPLKTTFNDWFDSNNAFYSIGAGFEHIGGKQKLRVEDRRYFYRFDEGLTLGEVANLRISVAADYFHNSVKVGYESWQQEEDGGLDEFNTVRNYSLPITKVKKEYTAMSKYIGAGYAIESKRRESYAEEPSRDTAEDNDFFVVCVLRTATGFESETNTQFAKLEGVKSPSTVYNARLTPTRMLLSHLQTIHIGVRYQFMKEMLFNTGEGNVEMISRLYTERDEILEKQNWAIGQFPVPLMEPNYYEFEVALDLFQRRYLRQNPYNLITFKNERGTTFQGHLMEAKLSTTGLSTLKLVQAAIQPAPQPAGGANNRQTYLNSTFIIS